MQLRRNQAGKLPHERSLRPLPLVEVSTPLTDDWKPLLANPDAKGLVRDEVVGKIPSILRLWLVQETGRREKITEIIFQDFEQSSSPPSTPVSITKSMFSVGDLWMGSLLVGVPLTSTSGSRPRLDNITGAEVGLIVFEPSEF